MTDDNKNGRRPLPEGWVWTTLGDVAAINQRDQGLRDQPDDLEVTFLPMAAVDEVQGRIANPQVRKLGEVRKGFTSFIEGDVLFAKITPSMENGKATIAYDLKNGIGFGSTEFHVIRPERGVRPEWLFHFVRQHSFREDAKANFSGTAGQLRVGKDFLGTYPFPLAPLPEQHRIVAEIEKQFTRLDAAVAALRRAKANLARYKAAVLKAAVEGRLVAQDPADEPAGALLGRILAERRRQWEAANPKKRYVEPKRPEVAGLPGLPEGWVWATLNELTSRITDGTHQPPPFAESGIPFIFVQHIVGGSIRFANTKFISTDTYLRLNERCPVEVGDILYSAVGSYGVAVPVVGSEPFAFQRHIAHLKPAIRELTRFLVVFLNSSFGRNQAHSVARGVAQKTVTLGDLTRFVVPLPPLPEQRNIVAKVEESLAAIERTRQIIDANLTRAEALRQGVLGWAFRGELVEQQQEDEPATALLQKINEERERRREESKKMVSESKRQTQRKVTTIERRTLYETLLAAGAKLPPHDLFMQAGFQADSAEAIDDFYEELRKELHSGRILETRLSPDSVFLEAVRP